MNLFLHALMRETGYFIFFIHSELKCGFGDFKASWQPGRPAELVFHSQGSPGRPAELGFHCQGCLAPSSGHGHQLALGVPAWRVRGCPAWCWSLLSLHPSSSILPGKPPSLLCSVSVWSLGSESTGWVQYRGWQWVILQGTVVCVLWEGNQAPIWVQLEIVQGWFLMWLLV